MTQVSTLKIMEMGSNLDKQFIVYLTLNKVNRKIYVGVHKLENNTE